jgi:hypothetical protein
MMKPIERKITASEDGKTLFLKVNGKTLSVPWQNSYFWIDEKVRVSIEKTKDKTNYVIQPHDVRLSRRETHWMELGQQEAKKAENNEKEGSPDGISSSPL